MRALRTRIAFFRCSNSIELDTWTPRAEHVALGTSDLGRAHARGFFLYTGSVWSNEELIGHLKERGVLKSTRIEGALRVVDRAQFVPDDLQSEAYGDYPLPIGAGQTISQPYTVVFMLELLAPQKGEKVLDVGSGSGWTTALLAHCVGERGSVLGLERVPELVRYGQENLAKFGFLQARIEQAGKGCGKPAEAVPTGRQAPFDKILISAAAEEIPRELLEQLKIGGRMVIPVKNALCTVDRTETSFEQKKYEGFVFVPLIQ